MTTEYEINTGNLVTPTAGDKMLLVRQVSQVPTPLSTLYESMFSAQSATSGSSLVAARADHTHAGYVAKVTGGTAGHLAVLGSDGGIADGGPVPSGSGSSSPFSAIAAYVYAHSQVYLCGGIGDGSAHTIGTAPSGHILAGITTIAQLAAVTISDGNGGTFAPFAFVNQAPFTGSTWALTDAKVANLDLDWLAIQASLWRSSRVFLPKGIWVIGSALPLPLLIRESTIDSPDVYGHPTQLFGEGQVASVIKAGSDFGAGVPLVTCGDPTATKTNELGRYGQNGIYRGSSVDGIGLLGPNLIAAAMGSLPCQMTGFAWGCGVSVRRSQINYFAKGISIVGDGHGATFAEVSSLYCGYACYWDEPSIYLYGDTDFDGCSFAGTTIAGIGVHGSGTILGATFKGKTYLNGPYGIFAETGGTGAQIINSVRFEKLMGEWLGNALIHDENGFSGGAYTTGAQRDISTLCIESVFASQDNGKFWGGNGRGRVAWIDVRNIENMVINGFDVDAAQYAPTQGPSGPAPISFIRARNISGSKGGITFRGPIQALLSGVAASSVPILNADCANEQAIRLEQLGSFVARTFRYINPGVSRVPLAVGDAIERYFEASIAGGQTLTAPVIGIALLPSLPVETQIIPVQLTGTIAQVSIGVVGGYTQTGLKKSTGIRGVTVTSAGSGGTPGSYTDGSFSGGGGSGATFSYTIKQDGTLDLASVTMTANGTGYASKPNAVFGNGLSGVVSSSIWPCAQFEQAAYGSAGAFGWTQYSGNGIAVVDFPNGVSL